MYAIEAKNISKTYIGGHFWSRKKTIALKNISLKIEKNQVFGLLGLNGAGKTTFIKILLGLVFPTEGEVSVLGEKAGNIQIRKKISFLPEMPYFPRYLTPSEILDFYGKLYELPPKERNSKTINALEKVGLIDKRKTQLKEFSKGMLQKVGIAQLLINNAEIYFLDEPTYGLDPLATKQMRDIILSLKKCGKTIFLSSHQINEVKQICDKIGILFDGSFIAETAVSKIKGSLEDFFVKKVLNGRKKATK